MRRVSDDENLAVRNRQATRARTRSQRSLPRAA
jgi:hypothetical protein